MIRLLVTGGREYGFVPAGCPPDPLHESRRRAEREFRLFNATLDALHVDRGIFVVIHGAATGADTLARRWAKRMLIADEAWPADWYPNGRKGGMDRSAGPNRNARMIAGSMPDLVVAFPGGKGTADCVARARAAEIEVVEIEL